ncbi:MAG: RNA-binding protein [Deltaproteobacteria bacterium]|nr:RNA-binding protein [Nannocystaceae bacterium]
MSTKLFVGGLSWGTTDDRLKEAFARFGDVTEAKIITDRETGRSRGFGFVTYADPTVAQQAMKELDGQELDGRTIRVNEAQNQTRPRGGGGGPRDSGPPREFRNDDRPRGGAVAAPSPSRDGDSRERDGRGRGDRDRDRDFGGDDGGGRRGRGGRY